MPIVGVVGCLTDFVWMLVEDAKAEILEDRNDVGQRERVARTEDLEANRAVVRPWVVQMDGKRIPRLVDAGDVGDGQGHVEAFAVGSRKGVGVATQDGEPVRFAVLRNEPVPEIVLERPGRAVERVLERRLVDRRHVARRRLDDRVDPDERALVQVDVTR
jgi:hypothetical protein